MPRESLAGHWADHHILCNTRACERRPELSVQSSLPTDSEFVLFLNIWMKISQTQLLPTDKADLGSLCSCS